MNRYLIVGFVLFILMGCSRTVDETEYPGDYVIEKSDVKNRIIVFANGKYKHRTESKGVVAIERDGYWDKDEFGGYKGITFKTFRFENGGGGGFWFVVPDRSWSGDIRLCIDVEESICFKKIR